MYFKTLPTYTVLDLDIQSELTQAFKLVTGRSGHIKLGPKIVLDGSIFTYVRDLMYRTGTGELVRTRPIPAESVLVTSRWCEVFMASSMNDTSPDHGSGISEEIHSLLRSELKSPVPLGKHPIEGGNFEQVLLNGKRISVIGEQSIYLSLYRRILDQMASKNTPKSRFVSTVLNSSTSAFGRGCTRYQSQARRFLRFWDHTVLGKDPKTPTTYRSFDITRVSRWLDREIRATRDSISKDIGPFVALTACDYHLDRYVSFSPDGTAYVNDYGLVKTVIRKALTAFPDQRKVLTGLLEIAHDRHLLFGARIEHNSEQLKHAGFKVVRVPARIGAMFTYSGGIFIPTQSESYTYLTTGSFSDNTELTSYFDHAFTESFGRPVHFLGKSISQSIVERFAGVNCVITPGSLET